MRRASPDALRPALAYQEDVMPAACSDRTTCRALADLLALDSSARAQVGTVHAAVDGVETVSATPALWVWSAHDRFGPQLFHEPTLDDSIAAACAFLSGRLATASNSHNHRALRTQDEQEGGIIIPDYMY